MDFMVIKGLSAWLVKAAIVNRLWQKSKAFRVGEPIFSRILGLRAICIAQKR